MLETCAPKTFIYDHIVNCSFSLTGLIYIFLSATIRFLVGVEILNNKRKNINVEKILNDENDQTKFDLILLKEIFIVYHVDLIVGVRTFRRFMCTIISPILFGC